MKKTTVMLAVLAIAGTMSMQAADNNSKKERQSENRRAASDLDKRISAINKLDNNAKAYQAGLTAVSKETAVPLPTIEAEHKQHPNVGLAGLFLAHEISVKANKPVDALLKQRSDGRTWTQLARSNGLDLDELETKLSRIESVMRGDSNDRTHVRDSASAASSATTTPSTSTSQSSLASSLQTLSTLDDQPLAMRTGLAAVSKETATPLPQLEELQKQHTSASVGDLFMAQTLALKTQKSAGDVLKQHTEGKSWSQLVSDASLDNGDLQQKLSRIEQAMRDAK